jgi:hypothetical protein
MEVSLRHVILLGFIKIFRNHHYLLLLRFGFLHCVGWNVNSIEPFFLKHRLPHEGAMLVLLKKNVAVFTSPL